MSEQKGEKKKEGETHIPHRHQKIGFYPSCDQTCAWTAKEITTRQQNRNKCNKVNKKKKERRRKEVLPFSLSLQILWKSFAYYEYAQRVLKEAGIPNQRILKNHGLKQSQEPGKKKTLRWSSSGSLKPKVP